MYFLFEMNSTIEDPILTAIDSEDIKTLKFYFMDQCYDKGTFMDVICFTIEKSTPKMA